jgi:hypothetical protein
VARQTAKPIVTQRSDERTNGSSNGREPNCGTEKTEHDTKHADPFGGGCGFEPKITWNTEADDKESGQHKREHAQGNQKPGGCAGRPGFSEANRGPGRDAHN